MWLGDGSLYLERVGVTCLMPAVKLSHGKRQLMYVRRGYSVLAKSYPSFVIFSKLLGFSDT